MGKQLQKGNLRPRRLSNRYRHAKASGQQSPNSATPTAQRAPPLATPARPSTPHANSHEAAWARLENILETGTGPIRYTDIPWPPAFGSGAINMVSSDRNSHAAKRQITTALRRWHPDKW